MPPDLDRLIRDTTFVPIDGGGILYVEERQRLYGLNAPAALVWCDLHDGVPAEETTARLSQLFGIAADIARQWRGLAIDSFAAALTNAATDEAPVMSAPLRQAPRPFERGAAYRLFDRFVHVEAPPEALVRLDSFLGHLRVDAASAADDDLWVAITPEGDRLRVESGGDPATLEQFETVVADAERRIVQDIVPRAPHFLAFHGALLSKGDRAVLLAAPSGSGKTTLSIALSDAGWMLHTDEMALLGRDLMWRGLPFRPCVKEENFGLIGSITPLLDAAMEHMRYGRRVKFPAVAMTTKPVVLTSVVFPRFAPDARTTLNQIDAAEALQQLLTQCIYVPPGFGRADVDRLATWHHAVRYGALGFDNVWDAARLIDNDAA